MTLECILSRLDIMFTPTPKYRHGDRINSTQRHGRKPLVWGRAHLICHYNEIALKGKNRGFFESALIENIRRHLRAFAPKEFVSVERLHGRILVHLSPKADPKKITPVIKNIFGIANFSYAVAVDLDPDIIKKNCLELLKNKKFKTFRISTQRSNKKFPLTSQKTNEEIGEYIMNTLKKKVSLEHADVECFVEIAEKQAFIYAEKLKGGGGLPVGSGGRALVLLSGGFDSPVAAYFAMKRGVRVDFIHFHSVPYASRASLEKVEKLAEALNKFQLSSIIYLVPFAETQKEIMMKTPQKFRVIFYRRLMLAIAEKIAAKKRYLAVYTGDAVGQVASQTLENIRSIEEAVIIPVLRPLIGFDKEEIIEKARQIDTYRISVLPHDDCCTRFMPKSPEIRSKLEDVLAAEKNLDLEKLISAALKNMEIKKIRA